MLELIEEHSQKIIEMLLTYTPKFLLALLILVIGFWLINRVTRLLVKTLEKRAVDVTLKRFLESLLGILLKAILVISAASMIGIETTSFIAVLGAAGMCMFMRKSRRADTSPGIRVSFNRSHNSDPWRGAAQKTANLFDKQRC